jgi:peptidoglycan L-alanyl-D-glutamate endopeptidase CwlK
MTAFLFSARSRTNLEGLHPDLLRVAHRALELTEVDFIVTEGLRTIDRQRELVRTGASKTLKSRHLSGHALDFMAIDPETGRGSWAWVLYPRVAAAFKAAAAELGVPIVWGGDWPKFRDGPHIELDRQRYPAP